MSYGLQVYVGWYYKAPYVPTNKVRVRLACQNAECREHGKERDAKFCPECGQPIAKQESREIVQRQIGHRHIEAVDDGRWVDEMHLASASESKEHVLIPNHHGFGVRLGDDEESELAIPLHGRDLDGEFARFNRRYGAFREAMERAYATKLEAVYGLVPFRY